MKPAAVTIILTLLLAAPGLAGCISFSDEGAPVPFEPREAPHVGDGPIVPDLPDFPDPADLPDVIGLPDLKDFEFPNVTDLLHPSHDAYCSESEPAPGSGGGGHPRASAPHAVSYEGPAACVRVSGADATASGARLVLDPRPRGFPAIRPFTLEGVNATFTPANGSAPVTLDRVTLAGEDAVTLTGNATVLTREPHRVGPGGFAVHVMVGVAYVELDPDAPWNATSNTATRVRVHDTLEGAVTLRLPDDTVANGTIRVASGEAGVLGSGELGVPDAAYASTSPDAATLRVDDAGPVRVANFTFTGDLGLIARAADVSYANGTARVDADVVQVWRDGEPRLTAGVTARPATRGVLAVTEATGNATLESVRVRVVDAPPGLNVTVGEFRGTVNATFGDAARSFARGMLAIGTLGLSELLRDPGITLQPGNTAYVPFHVEDEDARGMIHVRVDTVNGGSWEGPVLVGRG